MFELFRVVLDNGGYFARLSEIDELISNRREGFYVKHDVHGVPLDALIQFAELERNLGIFGAYFFMVPDHPLTIKMYSFKDQVKAMIAVKKMGHDIGLHIDPFFLLDQESRPLVEIFKNVLDCFNDHGVQLYSGNLHGNSKFKGLDFDGYGTSFDLFEEISRQPDFPILSRVPGETADLIRSNRIKLCDFGISHWGDMPFWTEQNNFIVTNFISDNLLEKKGTVNIVVQKETIGQYKLSDRQPPGSRTPSAARELVSVKAGHRDLNKGNFQIDFRDPKLDTVFASMAHHPVQFLVHPQHYC